MMLVLPYPPSSNRYWRNFRGRMVKSDDARTYQTAVRWQCEAMCIAPHTGPVALTMTFYRPAKRGDLSNRVKVAEDALQGYLYNDDKQVVELHCYQRDDKQNPRVEVEVSPR
jgi:crossover junction endodeoxyribonuclease RusA